MTQLLSAASGCDIIVDRSSALDALAPWVTGKGEAEHEQ